MYTAIRFSLTLTSVRRGFLQSGRGLGILTTCRDMHYFLNEIDKSSENYFLEGSFTSFISYMY